MKKKKKYKVKKKFIIIVLLIITIIIYCFNYNNNNNLLEKIGYSTNEIREIKKLSKEEYNTIIKYKYNKNLMYIINNESYNSGKLDLYLKYNAEYNNINYITIFNLINNSKTDLNKIEQYIVLLENYDNLYGILNYVNNYKNIITNINETMLNFMAEKYFIIDNIERYVNYYEKNDNLSYSEIITRINSNLDFEFYTNTSKSDTSKEMFTLVNKYYYLESNYIPIDIVSTEKKYSRDNAKLNKTAYENFKKLADEAEKNNLYLKITTGYRDYNFQSILYNNYINFDGIQAADKYSARPGFSEHQLGYSADLTNANNVSFDNFINTDEYNWLQNNAYKFGFILRYPKDKEYITGYQFESWHYRYVGIEIAKYIYENNITFEEYYAYFLR